MKINKKSFLNGLILFSVAAGFSICELSLFSVGLQDNIYYLKNNIINTIKNDDSGLVLETYKNGKNLGALIDGEDLLRLKWNHYSYASSTLMLKNNFYLRVSDETKTADYQVCFLESEPTEDNSDFILQGQLPRGAIKKEVRDGNYYDALLDFDNAIYVPDSLYSNIYSGFEPGKAHLSIFTDLDDSLLFDCEIHGSYKDESYLATQMNSAFDYQVVVASPKLFETISFSEKSLITFFKKSKNTLTEDNLKVFLNVLDNVIDAYNLDCCFRYSDNQNQETLNRLYKTHLKTNVLPLTIVAISLASLLPVGFIALLILLTKHNKKLPINFIVAIAILVVTFAIITVLFRILLSYNAFGIVGLSLLSKKSLYISIFSYIMVSSVFLIMLNIRHRGSNNG